MLNRILILLLLTAPNIVWASEECVSQSELDQALMSQVKSVSIKITKQVLNEETGFYAIDYTMKSDGTTEYMSQSFHRDECQNGVNAFIEIAKNGMAAQATFSEPQDACEPHRQNLIGHMAIGAFAPYLGGAIGGLAGILIPREDDGTGTDFLGFAPEGMLIGATLAPLIPGLVVANKHKNGFIKYYGSILGTTALTTSVAILSESETALGLSFLAPGIGGATGMAWAISGECKE